MFKNPVLRIGVIRKQLSGSKMPKAKGTASKKPAQPECDLCGDTICSTSQDSLQCEDCQLHMHRYCAGITRSYYHELCSKSTPFVCLVCTQRSQRVIIQQLQDEVSALRSELYKLRQAGSMETSATPKLTKQRWTLSRTTCNS